MINQLADRGTGILFISSEVEELMGMCDRIGIIDHGKIITTGSAGDLIKSTQTTSLEEAFISLTGSAIREQEANDIDHFREVIATTLRALKGNVPDEPVWINENE